MLDPVATRNFCFIGNDDTSRQFLAQRLRVGADVNGGTALEHQPSGDSAGLQNIVRFLTDIKDTLWYTNTQWWTSDYADSIRGESRALLEVHHMAEFCSGQGSNKLRSPETLILDIRRICAYSDRRGL
jgi:hypothetical protein